MHPSFAFPCCCHRSPCAGTLALLEQRQRWAPSGVSSAGAGVGALQGVPSVTSEAHGVPGPVERVSNGCSLPTQSTQAVDL